MLAPHPFNRREPRTSARPLRWVAVALTALALTACGSTVPTPGAGVGIGDASTGGTQLALPGRAVGGGAAAPGRAPSLGDNAGVASAQVAQARPAGTVPDRPSTELEPVAGVTPHTLRIGTYYFDQDATNALISSAGANSSQGDMRGQQRAVAAWINRNGGIAGRRVELVQHRVDIQADPSTEAQELCAAWTDGRGVFAGVGSLPTTNPILVSCLAKNRTVAIGGSSSNVGTAADFRRWAPYYYAPASVELVSAGRIYGQGLVDKGFLDRSAKVGILHVETPEHLAALRQGLLPALERNGITPTDVAGVTYDGSYADYGNLVRQAQSATLRFRSRGVTHVMFVDTGGALAFWFMQNAQSQGWSPRYGLSTLSAPSFLETNVDPQQLRGAVAVGWRPADDVSRLPANAARLQCQRIMTAAGHPPKSSFDLQLQLTTCSGFFFLKATLERATALDPAAFQTAAAGLGTTNVPSASGFLDRYAPGKPWGGSGYAIATFDGACGCFRYEAGMRRL